MASSFYNGEIKQLIWSQPWPRHFEMDVFENDECLTLVLYDDNLFKFTGEDQKYIAGLLQHVLTKIRDSGVPIQLKRGPREPNSMA